MRKISAQFVPWILTHRSCVAVILRLVVYKIKSDYRWWNLVFSVWLRNKISEHTIHWCVASITREYHPQNLFNSDKQQYYSKVLKRLRDSVARKDLDSRIILHIKVTILFLWETFWQKGHYSVRSSYLFTRDSFLWFLIISKIKNCAERTKTL